MEGRLTHNGAVLAKQPEPRRILHVGCGDERLPPWLTGEETRLDISPDCRPDIVASMTDMGDIGPFEVIFSSHCLEHLYPHDVPRALAEFLRVLAPKGIAIIFVPDLEDVRATEDVILDTPAGPVTGLDLMYGLRSALRESPHMAHHTGFTAASLGTALTAAGFEMVSTKRLVHHNLFGTGRKP